MKRNLLLSICVVACGLTASSHAQVKNNAAYGKIRTKAADETLTKAPEGKKTVYLMDLLTHDDAGGNIYDYHNEVAVTFCDNGDVYMPNFVSRKRMKGLLKGKLNLTGDTIIFANKQAVGYAPNKQENYQLYVANEQGAPMETETFKLAIDKGTGKITYTDQGLCLALYLGNDLSEMLGKGSNPTFVKKDEVEAQLDSYNFTYNNILTDNTVGAAKAKGYFDGKDFYVKGLDPKYPQAWLKGTLGDDGTIVFLSRQMVNLSSQDDPYVAYAAKQTGKEQFEQQASFSLKYDATARSLTGLDGDAALVNYNIDDNGNMNLFQAYNQLRLSFNELKPATPQSPDFIRYDASGQEFVINIQDKDTDGMALDTDFLTYRIYVDGKPYTFKKAAYPKMRRDDDMEEIPFTFSDYHTIQGSSNKKYVYFTALPPATKTIGVETLYRVKGVTKVSKRLVYDIATNTTSTTTGIKTAHAGSDGQSVAYYDLTGRRLQQPQHGVTIKVTTYTDGTQKCEKLMVR